MTPQSPARAAAIPYFPIVAFSLGFIATFAALALAQSLLLAPLLL